MSKTKFAKMIKETNPPTPYNKCLKMFGLKHIINNYTKNYEYFTIDSRELFGKHAINPLTEDEDKEKVLLKLKSGWFNSKWLYYNYGNVKNKPTLCATSNQFRDKMNINSEKYGDIGIPKIKYYVGDDKQKDSVIYRLVQLHCLPKLDCDTIEEAYYSGLSQISPLFSSNKISEYEEDVFNSKNFRIIVWDTETSGLRSDDSITQTAFYDVFTDTFTTQYFNPGIQISPEAADITGITNEFLENRKAPLFKDEIDSIDYLLRGDESTITLMFAHNSSFDETMLRREYRRAGREIPDNVVFIDSLEMARTWISSNEYDTQSLKGTFKLSTCDKDDSVIVGKDLYTRYFGQAMECAHDAQADVIGLWKVIQAMFSDVWKNSDINFIIKKALLITFMSEILDNKYMEDLIRYNSVDS